MAKKSPELVVGLDIGTTKICSIVGEITEEGIDIIGIGTHPSKGLRKGVVVNIEATVGSIRRAIEEAELMAGCEISTVYTGIAGGHIKGFNSQGIVAVKEKEVRDTDIQRVIDAAKAIAIPLDREVIHVLPQEFIIDDQGGMPVPPSVCMGRFCHQNIAVVKRSHLRTRDVAAVGVYYGLFPGNRAVLFAYKSDIPEKIVLKAEHSPGKVRRSFS